MRQFFALAVALSFTAAPSAVLGRDSMSIDMGHDGRTYSTEKPDAKKYGNDVGALRVESSECRMQADYELGKRNYDEAIRLARKAVQYNVSDPETHATLARCVTEKIYAADFNVPDKLIQEATDEWKLLRWRCSDGFDETEAAHQLAKLRLARFKHAIAKRCKKKEVEAKLHADAKPHGESATPL